MRFEQALRAMRRGETVRRRGWKNKDFHVTVRDGGFVNKYGACSFESDDVVLDDWVILRKKKKAPRFSEDELEPVGTLPRVGDRVWNAQPEHTGILRESMLTLAKVDGGWAGSVEGNLGGYSLCPQNFKEGHVRIVKRPPEALRDVFKDPRVGDVVKFNGANLPAETVRYFDGDSVLTYDGDRAWVWQRSGGDGSVWAAYKFTVISRAP